MPFNPHQSDACIVLEPESMTDGEFLYRAHVYECSGHDDEVCSGVRREYTTPSPQNLEETLRVVGGWLEQQSRTVKWTE